MMINRRLIGSVKEVKKDIALNVVYQWLGLVSGICFSLLLSVCAHRVLSEPLTLRILFPICIAFVLMLVRMFFSYQASMASSRVSRTSKVILRKRIMSHLLKLNAGYAENHLTSEVVQLCTEGVDQLETYFAMYLPQFFYAMLSPVTLFLITVWINFKAAVVLFLCVPLIPFSIAMVQKFAKKLLAKYWGKYTALSDIFLENLQGLTTLKVFQSDKRQHDKMNEAAEQFRVITMKVLTMQLNSISIMDAVAYGGTALGIYFAVSSYLANTSTLFAAMAIILLSAEFFLPMRQLGSFFHIAMNGMAASDRMFLLLDEKCEETGSISELVTDTSICANHLSYAYMKDAEVLKDVSFEIPERSFIGIAGPSGSGKSTLAKLLCGDLKDAENALSIGGISMNELTQSCRKQLITRIGFDAALFKGTVRENLLMARPDATDEMLWNALAQCQLKDFFEAQDGLDSMILESASNLSGGQRQRLALARAILKDSPIYLFDEATSSIDPQSEEAILKEIEQLRKTKTVIMISHRLANLKQADNILVLNQGKLEEQGNYEDLMKQNQLFASMAKAQLNLENFDKEDAA